ncbi:MAG: ubiquinol-cytochrome c reductase iron-sulfur subunit [Nitratireductor sp.]
MADGAEPSRRDFLFIATGAVGAVGAASVMWPFIDQMNPDASTRALASIDVDVSSIEVGQAITVKWRGKPVFIRNRTDKEVEEARLLRSPTKDPVAENENRERCAPATDETVLPLVKASENWIVMIGSCTHLGCIPVGLSGDFGGWFCLCHGSHYDTAGRIRKEPAPRNLEVPVYSFTSDTTIKIG